MRPPLWRPLSFLQHIVGSGGNFRAAFTVSSGTARQDRAFETLGDQVMKPFALITIGWIAASGALAIII
jgi:hypothetical protein